MKYQVNMNGSYANRFATYTEAHDFAEWLEMRYPNCVATIIAL